MKYSLRFLWYILRIVIIVLSAFAILAAAFYIAMDSANVYVIVTDGMKARVTSALVPQNATELNGFFTEEFLANNTIDTSKYSDFTITGINYELTVESLWCNPWKDVATVTVVETVKDIAYEKPTDLAEGVEPPKPPQWQRARYKITCLKINDAWRMDKIELVKALPAAPTASPVPSSYITASPLPTSTPSPSPAATPETSAVATATAAS